MSHSLTKNTFGTLIKFWLFFFNFATNLVILFIISGDILCLILSVFWISWQLLKIVVLFQGYDDDGEEKSSANMNMGPRTWYQVPPRDLRYPDVSSWTLDVLGGRWHWIDMKLVLKVFKHVLQKPCKKYSSTQSFLRDLFKKLWLLTFFCWFWSFSCYFVNNHWECT